MPTLILTPRFTDDSQSLWRAAVRLGWGVERLSSWRISDDLRQVPDPVLYVEGLFGPTLAEQLGIRLLEPSEDWLPRLPEKYRKRWVHVTTLGQARASTEPAFVKPASDKSFEARVYTGNELPLEFDSDSPVLVAEPVFWEKEFRCFVLDRRTRTLSIYLRDGELQQQHDYAASEFEKAEALKFIHSMLEDTDVDFPQATVLDVGIISGRGWAVVEQNAAWGAGIYGCDPEQVLAVLRCSAVRV